MSIAIHSGPARILGSGAATAFMAHPLRFQVGPPFELTIELRFRTDPSVPDVAVETETDALHVVLHCVNFDQADGRGSAVPVLLGEVDQLLLFLHFRVFRYGRTDDRTVHYTFYAVAKDSVNWTPEENDA